jgi:hypothetical protein
LALERHRYQSLSKSLKIITKRLKAHIVGILTVAFLLFSASAILALPIEPLNLLTPPSEAYFGAAGDPADITFHVTGKGGISAGNPLHVEITVHIHESALNFTVSTVEVAFEHATLFPFDPNQFPAYPSFQLYQEKDRWYHDVWIIYYQGGTFGASLTLRGVSKTNPYVVMELPGTLCVLPACNLIVISPEDVTTLGKTNALLMSVSLAFLAFSCLELRLEYGRNHGENCQRNHASANDKTV